MKLADWQDWLEGEWFESCHHEVEREARGKLLPFFREKFPTADAVVEAVDRAVIIVARLALHRHPRRQCKLQPARRLYTVPHEPAVCAGAVLD